ncbi:MAG: hypothetical protein ACK4WF_02570 [Candidatus Brocadiales bacterium]
MVILILVVGFFAFHVLMRLYIWPETYRKEKEEEMEGTKKLQKKFKPPQTKA